MQKPAETQGNQQHVTGPAEQTEEQATDAMRRGAALVSRLLSLCMLIHHRPSSSPAQELDLVIKLRQLTPAIDTVIHSPALPSERDI